MRQVWGARQGFGRYFTGQANVADATQPFLRAADGTLLSKPAPLSQNLGNTIGRVGLEGEAGVPAGGVRAPLRMQVCVRACPPAACRHTRPPTRDRGQPRAARAHARTHTHAHAHTVLP